MDDPQPHGTIEPLAADAHELRESAGNTAEAGRTAWSRSLETPLRSFLRTETGSAAVLLAAALAALIWVNVDASSYERVWHTVLSFRVGGAGISEGASGPLGVLAVLVGVVVLVASCVGFYVIKPLEQERTAPEQNPVGATPREARVK